MPLRAPISHHLDLYRYWLAKRGSRAMPARSDLNPCDVPALLPYLGLVNKVDGQFRWRLVGTAVTQEFGHDPTGSILGSYASTPESAAASGVVHERVFTTACPVFATGELKVKSGSIINMSLLTLPRSDDGTDVNMAVSSLVVRFNLCVTARTGWPEGARVKVRDMVDVHDAAKIEERCLDWERYSDDQRRRAEGIARRAQ